MTLVFLDVETTGLDPERHEVWELAYAVDDGPIECSEVLHSMRYADPTALAMNGYHHRIRHPFQPTFESEVREALTGATLVGANPAFDAAFLRARWGVAPWHYRLFDIEAYAAGVLGWSAPQGLANIHRELVTRGHAIPSPNHSAAGDVATLRGCFYALRDISQEASK